MAYNLAYFQHVERIVKFLFDIFIQRPIKVQEIILEVQYFSSCFHTAKSLKVYIYNKFYRQKIQKIQLRVELSAYGVCLRPCAKDSVVFSYVLFCKEVVFFHASHKDASGDFKVTMVAVVKLLEDIDFLFHMIWVYRPPIRKPEVCLLESHGIDFYLAI